MLKTLYNTQEEIPESMRGAYVQSGTKWVLDALDNDHPIVVKRDQLLTENTSQKRSITRLTNEKESLSVLPDGHKAVTNADADLIEKVKPFGSVTEVVTKLNEHKALKEESETRKRSDHLREVAKLLEYEPEAFVLLPNLPEFEIREVAGNKTVIAKVKNGDTITEKPAAEFIESEARYAPLLPALKVQEQSGVRVHGSRGNNGTPPKNLFDKIRDGVKQAEQQAAADTHPMFKKIPGRAQSATGE